MLLGCDKSFEKFDANNTGNLDTIWANVSLTSMPVNDFNQNLGLDTFVDSVSAQNGGVIYFPNNASITIPAAAFLMEGTPVTTGSVTVKFLLITQKGDMIRTARPCQSTGYLLESGGELYLDIIKNGKSLTLAPGKQITINYKSANTPPSMLMKGFTGAQATNVTGPYSCFNWTPTTEANVKVSTTSNGYQIITNTLQWIGCDYYNDSSAAKTTVALTMPLGFTNANTYTYIVYKNSNGVMQFDADASNMLWIKNKVPLNKAVVYISISKRGGDYYLATLDTYTAANQHIVLKPEKQKLQDILNYLSSL